MAMRPNLHFPGHARDVLEFYHAALGGTLEIQTYGGSPAAASAADGWSDKVLYGRLHSPFGDLDIMDAPPERADAPGGNLAISLDMDDVAVAERAFAHVAEGGTVLMPFEPTFFARAFGMCADKFGTRWMVMVPMPMPVAR